MKGAFRSTNARRSDGEPNFNNWAEKMTREKRHKEVKRLLGYQEKKERLNKFRTKTAFAQTASDEDNLQAILAQGEPLLPTARIRDHRMPLYNGLVMNLADEGYPATANYIKDLIVLDDMYSKHEPARVLLRHDRPVLDRLARGLRVAEDAKRRGDITAEAQTLGGLAVHFMNATSDFHWLAEELLDVSVGLLQPAPGQQSEVHFHVEAILRYTYSTFLLRFVGDQTNTKRELQRAMDLSRGKHFWFVDVDGQRRDNLYLRCCVFLSDIELEDAYRLKGVDMEQAIQSCRDSLHWAKQAYDVSKMANGLRTLAAFYLDANKLSLVYDIIQEHMKLCKTSMFHRELCEGYVLLSNYYEALGDHEKEVKVVEELISFALEKRILDIVMKAHMKLAKIYQVQRKTADAKYNATAAYKYCRDHGTESQMQLATCVMGIAQADRVMPDYLKLILMSSDQDKFQALIDWKTLRIPFYGDNKKVLFQPEIEQNLRLKDEIEELRAEEIETEREEKILRSTSIYYSRVGKSMASPTMRSSIMPPSARSTRYTSSALVNLLLE